MPQVGDLVGPIHLDAIAHGGHCVGRLDSRVVFVRHGLPGEVVTARITDTTNKRFWRADAVTIQQSSPDRVASRCPVSGQCGGCDFQHVSLTGQRQLKTAVLAEQLQRLAGIEWVGEVRAVGGVPDVPDGLGWRTRMRYQTQRGVVGLRAHRSHQMVELPANGCPIAHPEGPSVGELAELAASQPGDVELLATVADDVMTCAPGGSAEAATVVTQTVGMVDYQLPASGFWQVHPSAAKLLSSRVLDLLAPTANDHVLDLYCGVGLFAGQLVGRGARVTGVETNRESVKWARRNVPSAVFIATPVAKLTERLARDADLVVLDPPRSGAGEHVVRALARGSARTICYVACDPAALARDLATFERAGWHADHIEAWDLFPMTHHMECLAVLSRP